MNKRYFKDAEEALAECDELTRDDFPDSEDRATISAFYNGRQTMTTAEAEARGVSELTNHLFGYDSINTASEQINSIYNKSPIVWHVDVKNAPPELEQKWSMDITKVLNETIKRSKRLKSEFKSFSGEVTLFGSHHFMFLDNWDWCPRSRRPMAPRGSGINPGETDYFCLRDEIRLKDLYRFRDRAKKAKKGGMSSPWNLKAIEDAIYTIEGGSEGGDRHFVGNEVFGPTPEENEYNFQIGTTESNRARLALPVYYLYTSRPEKPGTAFDLTILARYSTIQKANAVKQKRVLEIQLFDQDEYYEDADSFLHSFFMDASLGGKTSYHRSMGLGELNYDSDVDVEEFFNDFMQGSKENMRRMFTVSNAADVETVNRWLNGEAYSNILPEGVTVAEVNKAANYQHAGGAMQMLMQLTRQNANASISNRDAGTGFDELEVQALERQGRNAQAVANRMNDIYDNLNSMGAEIFERFLQTGVMPMDLGYEEIHYFQEKLNEMGIPRSFLAQKKDGVFVNVEIRVNRVAGDGDRVRETMVNRSLMSRLHLFNPEAQQEIIRRVTAAETQDYDLAERLVPRTEKLDGTQVARANNENDASLRRGITGYVPPINDDDIPLVHINEHFGGIEALLAKGQVQGWEPVDLGGFQSMIQHIGQHIAQIEAIPEQKELSTRFKQQLQGYIRQGQEYATNLQQKMEAERDPMSQAEQVKAQQNQQKIDLATRQQLALEQNREERLQLDTAKFAAGQSNANAQIIEQQEQGDFNRQNSAVRTAADLQDQDFQQEQAIRQDVARASDEVIEGTRSPQGRPPNPR